MDTNFLVLYFLGQAQFFIGYYLTKGHPDIAPKVQAAITAISELILALHAPRSLPKL